MADETEQVRVLRAPVGQVEEVVLDLHRALYPERYLEHWHAQPQEDWPQKWDGESVYEWDSGTIEWAAGMVEDALARGGVIG
jgi:acetoin utilization deacetylase AcuC-like enzyme